MVLADRGYDHGKYRRLVWDLGVKPLIAWRGTEHGSGPGTQRWGVERAFAHLHWCRLLRMRWEVRDDVHEAFLTLSCSGDGSARHRLREGGPPGRRAEGVGEVLRLVHHVLVSEFHDAHRVRRHTVVGDDAFAHPQIRVAGDPLDDEVPIGRVPAALRRNRRSAPEPLT
ncbi:hypothetical protein AB0L59_36130 [Streptomyces sp. NPDC052109]|uniref:hypothetical protein n=1 Tax=Streptomyces sp. NPDC052109 TaxID=3155527 RepID=UPI003425EEE7